ncbi:MULTISPECIES: 3',5'-cyclic nucleotide phosphodiesterase [unclassified Roseateles]|uniref:3',5'-cyclic nucleotide phosphodiesterase n=1 Tax=unclassified Roseateles TaxID=2626991 RepID=UPI000A99FF5B|nr:MULTISPECIES: 3',5'-cyclic nucleotide phosphodiesterase [unclassified Roseateles]
MPSPAAGHGMAGLRAAVAAGAAPRVASELLALFEHVAQRPDKLQWVNAEMTADLGGAIDPALARAGAAVAAAIDAQPDTFDRHSYHNRQHFCEVALTAYGLCLLARLSTQATQLVVLAALVHDAVHEGRPQAAFVQERASVDSLRALLAAAGLAAAQTDCLMVLVLATETGGGTAYMSAVCQAHAGRAAMPLAAPAGAPELAALVTDPELAQLARILCEADVLPSIGLDDGHALRMQERLAREWGRPLGPRDKLAFMDGVLQQGYIGGFFLPCVRAMHAALAGGLHAVAQG